MEQVKVGIGFVTGRKNFQNVLRTHVNNWANADIMKYDLHLFIAYDLAYKRTKVSDYHITNEDIQHLLKEINYLGTKEISDEVNQLVSQGVLTKREANLLFTGKYAAKRNAVLYHAIKKGMDYLLFLDDDEYPVAVVKTKDGRTWWIGQTILTTHLRHLSTCDITHGHHCGYISPIPSFQFNDILTEGEFRIFIEAISNDIITWDSIKQKMDNGGVDYASEEIINTAECYPVEEKNGMKFISGANLGFNLKDPKRVFPFYNPPDARGEDTFMATCLTGHDVRKVPCYTFHDGFAVYNRLLCGALPSALKPIRPDSPVIRKRFLKAAMGWVRYKPLMLYITRPQSFEQDIERMKASLQFVLPKLIQYFDNEEFQTIFSDFEYYTAQVQQHKKDFDDTQKAWKKLMEYLSEQETDSNKVNSNSI